MRGRGFTLIELLITVVIVGVIATMGIAGYQGMVERARAKQCQVNLGVINAAVKQYALENDALPATLSKLSPEQLEKAYAEIMERQGIGWHIAKAIIKFDDGMMAYAQSLVTGELLPANSPHFNCPSDPAQNFKSYAINTNFAGIPWRLIPPSAVLVADGDADGDQEFTSLAGQTPRHKKGTLFGANSYALAITKGGSIVNPQISGSEEGNGVLSPSTILTRCGTDHTVCVSSCYSDTDCINDCEKAREACINSL